MIAAVRCGTLLAILVFSVACGSGSADRLTFPSSLSAQRPSMPQPPQDPPPEPPPAPRPAEQPPLTGPATTYLFSEPLSYRVSDYTIGSKYVLYDNGAFTFQYPAQAVPYLGAYRQENGGISFDFSPTDGSQDASGALNGDLLEVRYSLRMEHSDFENAVYRRSQ
jgi:hypothetical protein